MINKRNIIIIFLFILISSVSAEKDYIIKKFPVWSKKRAALTLEYQKIHYGLDTYKLKDPKIIVIHYTAMSGLKKSLNYFKSPYLSSKRKEIIKGGRVNVGVHFVVAKDGTIYSLLPEDVAGRHIIGFNYTSFGIENVGGNYKELTKEQIKANAWLVQYLLKKYSTLEYLVGHHEYADQSLPHFRLYKELDKNYKFTIKIDPGKKFMKSLREKLESNYDIILKK